MKRSKYLSSTRNPRYPRVIVRTNPSIRSASVAGPGRRWRCRAATCYALPQHHRRPGPGNPPGQVVPIADPGGSSGVLGLTPRCHDGLSPCYPTQAAGDRRRVVKDVFEDAYNYMKSGDLMRQVVNKINGIDFNNLTERQHFGDIYEQILNDLQSAGNAGEYSYAARRHRLHGRPHRPEGRRNPASIPPAARAAFLPARSATCATVTSRRPEDEQNMQAALARGREEAASAHALRHKHAAARHGGRELRAPRQYAGPSLHQLHPVGPRGHRADQSALRRARGGRYRVELPDPLPHPGDRGSVPRPHHPLVEAGRARRGGAAGRLAVRRGRRRRGSRSI